MRRPAALFAGLVAIVTVLAGVVTLLGSPPDADARLAADSLRRPLTRERFYFVMTDRFANGDPTNDTGGLTGDRLSTGFDPTDKGFYHGGDLRGVLEKLDYIQGLGTTAIWLTPAFVNKPVQGPPGLESAGYHGYWVTDFTRIDPHLGTNDEMRALVAAAHARGMKVFFDIITNHTADVIDYAEGRHTYRPRGTAPYTPVLRPGDEHVKKPDWLNDPANYHNRGDSTFEGESSLDGDFFGLDDLATERPEVVAGMGEIYAAWVDFGIDGFRIDTVKHVNLEFWQQFVPGLLAEARRIGKDDFFAFGEVYDTDPAVASRYTTAGTLQATLDFGFQARALDYAKGRSGRGLAALFAEDDRYTDADSNAYQLPTFLGNHDMGRAAMLLQQGVVDSAELLQRLKLAYGLLYAVRGNPVVYYGDEQGLVGYAGDKDARQDLFATRTPAYANQDVLGGTPGSRDRYDTAAPLYRHLAELAALRAAHPALADGAQQNRYAADGPGVFAVSRYDRAAGVEYVVAANNDTQPASASFPTWTPDGDFRPVYGTDAAVRSAADRTLNVTVPPLSVAVWRSATRVDAAAPAPQVTLRLPAAGLATGRAEIAADVTSSTFAQATFLMRPAGTTPWQTLGTDDNAPFRVFVDVAGVAPGTTLEYRVVVKDAAGRVAAAAATATTAPAAPAASTSMPAGDATNQAVVTVPGTHGPAIGCAEWDPACPQGRLTLDPADGMWRLTVPLPPGDYSFKIALNGSWAENYGAGGTKDGPNITFTVPSGAMTTTFTYDPATHRATVTSA